MVEGIEAGEFRPVDRDLAQKPNPGELVESVVDGGERHAHPRRFGLRVEVLGRDVASTLGEQNPPELHTLARRPEPGMAQLRRHPFLVAKPA